MQCRGAGEAGQEVERGAAQAVEETEGVGGAFGYLGGLAEGAAALAPTAGEIAGRAGAAGAATAGRRSLRAGPRHEVNDPCIGRLRGRAAAPHGGHPALREMLPPQLNLVLEIKFADATTALWSEKRCWPATSRTTKRVGDHLPEAPSPPHRA